MPHAELQRKPPEIRRLTDRLATSSSPHASELYRAFSEIDDAFKNFKQVLDSLSRHIDELESSTRGIIVKSFFVQDDLEVPAPTAPVGSVLVYIFEIDEVGGYTITLPDEFGGLFDVTTNPLSVSGFMVYRSTRGKFVPFVPQINDVLIEE